MELLSGTSCGKAHVEHSFELAQTVSELFDAFAAASYHNDFGADAVAQVHVGGGKNMFGAVMLDFHQLFTDTPLVVVVD